MKILLLDPSYSQRKLLKDPVLSRCAGVPLKAPYIYPPIGLAYIASALREFLDIDVKILDAQVDDFDIEMTNEFDLVVINTSTPTINNDIRLSQKIKELSKTRVVFIGLHSAYFHEELIEFCDFVVALQYYFVTLQYYIISLHYCGIILQYHIITLQCSVITLQYYIITLH